MRGQLDGGVLGGRGGLLNFAFQIGGASFSKLSCDSVNKKAVETKSRRFVARRMLTGS
ncbi:hypothetical protein ACQP1K_27795 [Sphaerimonospora sp. CA-214678]|uniref:hypothetical protein n=1 Tax=Sphaerimonospora sp. CA-214678 TaxID=3240029 RepID=UPI003D929820